MTNLAKDQPQKVAQGQQPEQDLGSLSFPDLKKLALDIFSPAHSDQQQNHSQENTSAFSMTNLVHGAAAAVVSPVSTVLDAATRATFWAASYDWSSLYKGTLGLEDIDTKGFEKESAELLKSWEELQESAPHQTRIGKNIQAIHKEMELLKNDSSPEALTRLTELKKELGHQMIHLHEHLEANSARVGKVLETHEALLAEQIKIFKNKGYDAQEIQEKLKPLLEARKKVEQDTVETYKKLVESIDVFLEEDTLRQELLEHVHDHYCAVGEKIGFKPDENVGRLHQGAACCTDDIREFLLDKKRKIEEFLKNPDSRLLDGRFARTMSDMEDRLESSQSEVEFHTEEYLNAKNQSLIDNGVSGADLGVARQLDNALRGQVAKMFRLAKKAFGQLQKQAQKLFVSIEEHYSNHVGFLRMQNAALTGGAGENQLALGLFDPRYARSALAFIEEHARQLALSRKCIFDEENYSPNSRSQTNIYHKPVKTAEEFYADFLKSEKETNHIIPVSAEQREKERLAAKFKETRKTTAVTGLDGKLSPADEMLAKTSGAVLKQVS